MFYRNVRIERDRMTVVTKLVASHEIPVLKRVFDKNSVTVQPGWQLTRRPYGSARAEYDRLRIVYGVDPETGRAFVEDAFRSYKGLWQAIPWWVRALDHVLRFKMPSWRQMTRRFRKGTQLAVIPVQTAEFEVAPMPEPRETNKGMLAAIDEALRQCGAHNSERERFRNERID